MFIGEVKGNAQIFQLLTFEPLILTLTEDFGG